jgi:hypothetical protein
MKRYAIVSNARSRSEVEAYLPDNYKIVYEYVSMDERDARTKTTPNRWVVEGEDVAGWTLDGYVIPRYASGLIGCEEIDLSHPIMKEVSAAV